MDIFLTNGPAGNGAHLLGSDPATASIPPALRGTFDVVRIAGLGGVLRENEWRTLLANLYTALKPGGYVVAVEGDPVAYTERRPPPLAGVAHDLTAAMSGPSALAQINCVLTGAALQQQLVVDLSYRLGQLLQTAGFHVKGCSRALGPTGGLCSRYTGLRGTPLHDLRATATTIVCEAIEALSRTLLSRGRLQAPLSTSIGTEEGRASLARGAQAQVQEGVLLLFAEWVAQRPIS
ncbi:unnamed protein product [Peniophora sp. CBMAI 1063]|nr:unnamed protein product [Peniophora sp. CBMAI 1063]